MNAHVCSRLDGLLAGYDEDRLSPAEERVLREHLTSCASCAAEALRHDPVLLFTRDSATDVMTAEARERFVGGVLAATGAARARRRLGPVRFGVGLRVAASLLLAASFVGVWFVRGRSTPSSSGEPRPAVVATDSKPSPVEAPPSVEDVAGVGATVYQFTSTTPGDPTVVFVVDRNADI